MIVDNRVNLNQISVTQDQVLSWKTMANFIVDADARCVFITFKSDLFCNCAMFFEILARKFFDFPT